MKTILFFLHDTYEDLELWYPKIRLEEAGYKTILAAPEKGKIYYGKHSYPCKSNLSLSEVKADDYAGLVISGGFSPDKLRREPKVLEITSKMHHAKKPIAFICHGGWIPISAKILKNRHATGARAIKDDLENAGARFSDEAVIIDENLISSRSPEDLPQFCKALIKALEKSIS